MNFISREEVLLLLEKHGADPGLMKAVNNLFSFPAPNPDWRQNNRNVMGQTEQEFWDAVDGPGR